MVVAVVVAVVAVVAVVVMVVVVVVVVTLLRLPLEAMVVAVENKAEPTLQFSSFAACESGTVNHDGRCPTANTTRH